MLELNCFGIVSKPIRCDDPVIDMEHKELWMTRGEEDESAGPVPFGKAGIMHEGSDVTIVTLSRPRLR